MKQMSSDDKELGHGFDQLFGGESRVAYRFDFGQQHHEFVSPVATDGVREADTCLQTFCSQLQ